MLKFKQCKISFFYKNTKLLVKNSLKQIIVIYFFEGYFKLFNMEICILGT